MSRDFEFLKNIIELILAVVSLLDLIGAGTIRRVEGKLVTSDPWALFIHQLKRQTKIPTRHLVRIAMDLYSKMTPEMKDNLIRHQKVSPEIIRQIEERFLEYTRSNLPPLMRQEALAQKLRQIELKDLPITREMLYQEVAQGGYHWVEHVLPDGRIIWRLEPVKIRGLIPESTYTPTPSFARILPQPPRLLPPEVKLELPEASPREYKEEYEELLEPKETVLPTVEGLSSIGEPLQEPSPIPVRTMISENQYKNLLERFNELKPNDRLILKQIYTYGLDKTLKSLGITGNQYKTYRDLAVNFLPLFPSSKFTPKAVRGYSTPPPQPSAKKKKEK